MPMIPWTQQKQGARFGEPPPIEPKGPPGDESSKWNQLMPWKKEFIWPWEWDQPEFQALPGWAQTASKASLGVGTAAAGLAAGIAGPGLLFGLGSKVPWLSGLAKAGLVGASHPLLSAGAGLAGGLLAPGMIQGGGTSYPGTLPGGQPGAPPPGEPPPTDGPAKGDTRVNYGPTGIPFIEEWNGTAWVRTVEEAAGGEETQPQVIDVGGQQFWWNPTGGMYGTGGWSLIPSGAQGGLTAEQRMSESGLDRAAQMEMLIEQYKQEQLLQTQGAGEARGQQEAAAAQQMAQMYAADPYKYWAQLGTGTPEAVSRLTGGQVAPGEQMQQGVPLSTPSAQWWGNLLPSEQQQISGGLNWMGVDPQDWYSMYQRMIPGLGQRQMGPVWARQ